MDIARQEGYRNPSAADKDMRRSSRRDLVYIWTTLIMSIALAGGVCLLNYIVDPLQFYRQATWYTPIFSWEQRFQNAGLARNWEYNTIILGTSMTENFVPSHVDETFGGAKTLKLSISGSSLYEERLAGEVALRTGQVERIIWGLDYASFRGGKELLHEESGPYPTHLYDTNILNDVKYLFNVSTVEDSLRILKRKFTDTEQPATNLDYLNNWMYGVRHMFGDPRYVYEHYHQAKQAEIKLVQEGETDSLTAAQESFDHNVLRIVREHPEVEFHFFYPPYSILRFQLWYEYQPERFFNQMEIKKYIYQQLASYPNVHIHDFQSEQEITHQLDYYKDVSHYSQEINQYMIEQMVLGTYEMRSMDDVVSINDELLRQVMQYQADIPESPLEGA
jgi:hypothetical protein